MLEDYFGIIPTVVISAGIALMFLLGSEFLGPKSTNPVKEEPFECGQTPFEIQSGSYSVRFYLAGMLFVLFDVEIIFLFPWAVLVKDLGFQGFAVVMVFLGLFLLGDAYAWRKGAFTWK